MEFLIWLEENSLVTWVRESDSLLGYTLFLAGHTIGLVFLVGPNLLIAARVLGVAPGLPLKPMLAFRPLMSIGLWLTIVTGSILFATAPVSYVRNGVFLVKIAAIVLAVLCVKKLMRALFAPGEDPDARPVPARAKVLTAMSIALWTVAVVTGRLTAYSYVVVFISVSAFLVLAAAVAGCGYLAQRVSRRSSVVPPPFPIDVRPAPLKGGK